MDMLHEHIVLGAQIPFLGSKDLFSPFFPQKYIFSYSMKNSRSMDMSHDHTDFGPQIPFLGSDGLFLPV
jgi:hypothetical protein